MAVGVVSFFFFDDHVISEILSLLPLRDATRFKSVCKAWHRLVSDPRFRSLRLRRRPSARGADVSPGFFLSYTTTDPYYDCLWQYRTRQCCLDGRCHEPHEPHEGRQLCLDGCYEIGVLAVCDGLLFVVCRQQHYYVWNPSSGSFARIAPLPAEDRVRVRDRTAKDLIHYGLGKGGGGGGGSSRSDYEIVAIDFREEEGLSDYSVFFIYSSRTGTWTRHTYSTTTNQLVIPRPALPFISLVLNPMGLNPMGAASSRRSLHWITPGGRAILAFDLTKRRFRKIGLPAGIGDAWTPSWFGSVDDDVYLVSACRRAVAVWILEEGVDDNGGGRWEKVLEAEDHTASPNFNFNRPSCFDGRRITIRSFVGRMKVYDTLRKRWDAGRLLFPSSVSGFEYMATFVKDNTEP